MPARRALAISVLLVVAGCTGVGSQPAPSNPATTPAGSPTTDRTPTESVTTDATTRSTTDRWLTGVAPEDRLTLVAADDLTVTVTVADADAGTTRAASATYNLTAGESVSVTEVRVDGRTTLSMNGTTVWQGVVGSSNVLTLRVHGNGSVTVAQSSVK